MEANLNLTVDNRNECTIGSRSTGRALISTWGSAATPPAYRVQAIFPSLIQVIVGAVKTKSKSHALLLAAESGRVNKNKMGRPRY